MAKESIASQTLTSHARARADRAAKDGRFPAVVVQPGTYVGRYLVLDLIGTGGMGSVYRAYDPKLNRDVAVKLIRVESHTAGETSSRPRLLREAQALAQMHHPHVVGVFDVGEFRERVFFAMELIEGSTMRDLFRRADSDHRTLLHLLDQAGRGLAAAHGAGLVHRDFKPENVLIDGKQRVKVVDFGLARAVDAHEAEGAFVGTPAYMAPEQYMGRNTDARSDQFSFSIVAYEALFGRHPFLNEHGIISMAALCAGKIEVPSRRLDSGYLRVLGRGLSPDPADRYPSLEHLLDELVHVPRRRRRRALAIAAVVCAATGFIGVPAIQKYRAQRCDMAASQALDGIWDGPRRAKVEKVLAGDGNAFGHDVWVRVSAALDGYAEQWTRTSVELCRSTEWWHGEGDAMQKRLSFCLDDRRRALRAVTDVLGAGDRDVSLRAPDMLIQLDSLSTCTNTAALAHSPLPAYDSATSIAVERIRELLARSRALNDAGKDAPSEEAAQQALELARKQNDRGLAAEALYRLSIAQVGTGKLDESETNVVQAVADAESSGHERLLPLVWTQLLMVVGHERGHPNEVEHLVPFTEAMVKRFDPRGPAHYEFLVVLGLLEHGRGRYDRAIERFSAALDVAQRVFGENDARRVRIYLHLANTERLFNQLDKGIVHTQSALRETEALFGLDHPKLVFTLALLAHMLSDQGDAAGTETVAPRALHIVEQVSASDVPNLSNALHQLGMAYLRDAQPAAALPLFRRAYGISGTSPTNAAVSLAMSARAEEALGHLEIARTTFEEAVSANRRLVGPGHPQTLLSGVWLAHLLRTLHREREALQLCTQLLDAGERKLGPHGVFIALVLSCVGEGYEQLGQLPEALAALERAERLLEVEATPPRLEFRAPIHFALARVLWRTGGDRERARRLANEAADNYQHAGRAQARHGAVVQSWLTKVSAQQR
ncbi:tetratricopeptide repeat protein [Pendulispora rubella]|uniref:Tetratricopeptide repeat protein n=1 Tax=Pendulispora rubella TaxID=2741070 RepID=A0ABZ2L5T6_9BACT